MKLGIIASILLLSAALVGPVGYSFAQTAGTNSTSTNSTSVAVTTTVTATKTETKTSPPKPLSDEERVQMKIAEEKAKLAKRFDDKSKMIREKALQKSKAINDILAERLKKLDEKRVKANEKEQKKDDRLKERLLKGNSTDTKTKFEVITKKKIASFEERQADAKKRFDEQMQKRNEKFEKLVNLKAKRPVLEKPQTEEASSSSDTDSSSKESSPSETSTGSSTGTNSTSSSTPTIP